MSVPAQNTGHAAFRDSGAAAAALSAVTAAENARDENGDDQPRTGMEAEVTDGVARHRDRPEAGLMARGL